MQTESKLVKKNSAGALSTINPRDFAGRGAEEISSDDKSTPILKILHQLSPECNSKDSKYVKDAKPGMIYAKSFGTLIDGEDGINVVVAHTQMRFPEWQERGDSASAPVGTHLTLPSDAREERNGRYRLPNGNYVEKTASHFVIVMGDNPSTALISMKSTQLKISRKWNSMMSGIKMKGANGMFTPASFSHIYKLKTTQMSNDKGTWFGWEVSKVGPVTDKGLYDQAKAFSENISRGSVKAKHGEDKAKDESII